MASFSDFLGSVARAFGASQPEPTLSWPDVIKSLEKAVDLANQGIDPFPDEEETITIPVDSSCLAIVEYKPSAEEMRLLFARSGEWYRYDGVSAEEVDGLTDAESVGRYFNANVRNNYPYTRGG